jgi:peptide/nickel transport system substrate-binding protein
LLLSATPASAASTPKSGGTLTIDVAADPGTLNPFQDGGVEGNYVSSDIRDRLVDPNAAGQPAPALATSWYQPNPTSYIFNLRHGVKFSNGQPFTSADAQYTFTQLLGPNSGLAGSWTFIKDTQALGTYKFEINMTSAYPFLLSQLELNSDSGIVPNNWMSTCAAANDCDTTVIGTGPFMLKQWSKGIYLTLERNPYYWDKPMPYLNEVIFRVVPDPETEEIQLKTGAADVLYATSPSAIASLKKSAGVRIYTHASGNEMEMLMNSSIKPFNNTKVREAMELAINRQQIVKAILLGYGLVPTYLVPPGNIYFDPSAKPPPYDPTKAKALLASAGYNSSHPLSFVLRTINQTYFIDEATLIEAQLKKIGVHVSIVPLEKTTFLAPLFVTPGLPASTYKSWQAGLEQYSFGSSSETLLWEQFSSTSYINTSYVNIPGLGGFTDPTLQKLVTEGVSSTTTSVLKPIYEKLYNRLEKDALYVRISFADNIQVARSNVEGFKADSQFEYPLQLVWLK